jgi:hypothetical protein
LHWVRRSDVFRLVGNEISLALIGVVVGVRRR